MPIGEMIIIRFQKAIINAVRLRIRRYVGSEQDAIGISKKKSARGIWLTAEFRDTCANINVIVGQSIQHTCDIRQVLRITTDMRSNESSSGVPGNHILESGQERFQAGK